MRNKHIVVTDEVFLQVKKIKKKMKPSKGKTFVPVSEVISRLCDTYEEKMGKKDER